MYLKEHLKYLDKLQNKDKLCNCIIDSIKPCFWKAKGKIEFYHCEFKQDIICEDTELELIFNYCTFHKNFLVKNSINPEEESICFKKPICFNTCLFNGLLDLRLVKFENTITIQSCIFKSEVIFFKAKQECIENVNNFTHCVFENNIDFTGMEFHSAANFIGSQFQGDAKFTSIKFGDNSKKNENKYSVSFLDTSFFKNANFQHAQFGFLVNFRNAKFYQAAIFDEAPFHDDVDLTYTSFEKSSSFRKTKFYKEVIFHNTLFNKSYFIDTIFSKRTKEIGFKSCIFEGMFYFETENIKPIFFDCNFGNQVSIKLKYLKCDYEELKEKIKSLAEEQKNYCELAKEIKKEIKKEINISNKKELQEEINKYLNEPNEAPNILDQYFHLDKLEEFLKNNKAYKLPRDKPKQVSIELHKELEKIIEQDDESKETEGSTKQEDVFEEHIIQKYRSSFRKLKSNNLAYHNLIDASRLHTQELYARELELEHQKDKTLKEKVEQYQLLFYRKLCDHHTDLALNIKWLIITIGMFASMLFMIKLYKYGLCILNTFNFYGLYLSALGSFILSALALFRCIDTMKAFVSINSIIIFWVICYKPKLIFGIANLIGDNSYNAFENLLITFYTLIVGLIIFSLQKTARKNTIIPN